MLSFSKCKYAFGCAIMLLFFTNYWMPIQLLEPFPVLIPEKLSRIESQNEAVSVKMNRKRKILERGCSMIGILYEMSQNGTSYENLLALHSRIHDLDFPLRQVFKKIFPEFLANGRPRTQLLANERSRTL